jgi:zinc transport system substrate-binding protein
MKYSVGIIVALVLVVSGWYFTGNTANQALQTSVTGLSVVTSFYPLQFAMEGIVGELGTVTNIGAGRDPHNFEPSTQDMVVLQQADLVVLQGAGFEPWGDDVQARLEADDVPVAIATAHLKLHEGGHAHDDHGNEHTEDATHSDGHAHGEESVDGHAHGEESVDDHTDGAYDPHTWLNPVLFSEMVTHLTEVIITIDPANAATYEANAAALKAELSVLDTQYTQRLSSCILDEVITSHDAFGYMADAYNFSVHAIAGLSTQDTPSVTTLAELRQEAQEGIGAILLEENSITAYGETLARETGLKTLSINPIAYVIGENEDYFSLMRANLDTFATALECDV